MNRNIVIKALTVFVAAALAFPSVGLAALTARANHDHITIDSFYHGSEVSVRGICDPGVDLVVKIESPDGHMALKKKDKVGGILWMNVGEVNFEEVPDLYFVQSTADPETILVQEDQDANVIGYPALERHVVIEPVKDEADRAKLFGQFLKLKQSSNLYFARTGGFDITEKDGVRNYYMKFEWPYQAKPGNYKVTVFAVKDGRVVETAEAAINVEQVGTIKTLSGMAKNNGALYGFISIIVALAAGFGVGLVFKPGGAH